jgi:general secretion pathway protein K
VALGLSLLEEDAMNIEGTTGPAFDALSDPWGPGIPYEELGGAAVRCTIADEYGKLNLNALLRAGGGGGAEGGEGGGVQELEPNPELELALRAVFMARGAETDPVDAILDWIDPDDEPRPEGAESDYYSSGDAGFACKNGPFDSVEELLMVRGVTPDLFFGDAEEDMLPLTDILTVRGHPQGKVNVNTAPREVLDAFGEVMGRTGIADIVLSERERMPFENEDDLRSRGILDQDAGEEGAPPVMLEVAGRVFRVRGDGMAAESLVRIEAFVERMPSSSGVSGDVAYRILDWRVIQ